MAASILSIGILLAIAWPVRAQGPAPPPLRISERQLDYPVAADDLDDLRAQLGRHLQQEGDSGHGRTLSKFQVRYELVPDPGPVPACRAGELRIDLEITTTLPRWQAPAEVPAEAHARWRAAREVLEAHEAVHRRHALAAAGELQRSLATLPSMPDCRALRTEVDRRLRRVVFKYRFRDERFDARTRAGMLPTP